MRERCGMRALGWVLVAQLLMSGCATVAQQGTGGSGRPREPLAPEYGSARWGKLEEAREAELESALGAMWGVAGEVREVGAVLEFTFWAEGGAFTPGVCAGTSGEGNGEVKWSARPSPEGCGRFCLATWRKQRGCCG